MDLAQDAISKRRKPNERPDVVSKVFKLKQRRNGGAEGDARVEGRPSPFRSRISNFVHKGNHLPALAGRVSRPLPCLVHYQHQNSTSNYVPLSLLPDSCYP